MSDVRRNINKLVSDKMKNRSERLHELSSQSEGDSLDLLESTGDVLADYDLYFSGMVDVIEATGIAREDLKSVFMAQDTNNAEMKLLEARMALVQELSEETEEDASDD